MYLSERPQVVASAHDAGGRWRGRRVAPAVVLLGTVSLLTDVSSEATAAVLPLFLTLGLGLSPLAYGLVDGVYQGASVLARVAGGVVADRSDRPKWVAVLGYATSAAARTVLLVTTGAAAVAAVLGVDRVGKGLRTAPRDALIVAASDPRRLGEAFGVHRALDTTGAVLGPLVAFGVLLVVPQGYRAVFVVSLAAAVLGLAVLVLLVPDLRPSRAAAVRGAVAARPSLGLLRRGPLGRVVAAAGLLSLLGIGDGFLFLALQQRSDLALELFPLLFAGVNVVYLVLAVPLGRLADHVGRLRLLVLAHLLLAAAYAVAAVPGGPPVLAVLGCLLLLGAFYAATDGVLAAAAAGTVPAGSRATAIATAQSVVALGRGVASIGFGWLWLWSGPVVALAVLSLGVLAALPVAWFVARPLSSPA
ncbi:MFS transporter [Nocardioides marmoraquaticus]